MIGSFAFLLLWVLVAVGLFMTAVRRGPRRAAGHGRTPGRSGQRAVMAGLSIVFLLLGIVVPALVIAGTNTKRQTDQKTFASACGTCHVLAAAGTTGTVGPNLDALLPTMIRVQSALRVGGTGDGRMPAGLLTGAQADRMARYVSAVAGKRSQ